MKNQKINSPNKLRAPVFYQKNENEKNESSSSDSKDLVNSIKKPIPHFLSEISNRKNNLYKSNPDHSGILFPSFFNMNDSPFSNLSTCYPLNKGQNTPNRGPPYNQIMGNYSSSPEYNSKFLSYQNLYNSPINNGQNNFSYNFRRKLFEEENKFPINAQTENKNIKKQKKNDLSMPEMRKDEVEKNEVTTNNIKKFFTDYGGYGYKCSCSKTQCNRYYCECFRSGLYCRDCNCKNCQNKPPENCSSNRHTTFISNKQKTELVTCTCTKSGCNKKYCECYKNGSKCNSSCRCVGCENTENAKKVKDEMFECTLANSIYIVHNKMIEEEIVEGNIVDSKNLVKKRKRSLSIQK